MNPRIVDAQVHLNMVGDADIALAAMDEAGIDTVVIDEYISPNPTGGPQIGRFETDTLFRYDTPYSRDLRRRAPERIRFLGRIMPDDPDVDGLVDGMRAEPGCVALRVIAHQPLRPGSPSPYRLAPLAHLLTDLRAGRYRRLFTAAARAELPVFLQVSGVGQHGDLAVFAQQAREYPDLALVLDHAGLSLPRSRADGVADGFARLDEVIALAEIPNVLVKWSHMTRLSVSGAPFPETRAALREVLDAFGSGRVMWASDFTVDAEWASWRDSVDLIAGDPGLSEEERAAVLGGTALRVLDRR